MIKLIYIIYLEFIKKFIYVKAFWINIFGTFISIIIYYFLWKYIYMENDEIQGFTMTQMTLYVILSRILSSQFSGGINRELSDWIYKGNIVIEMLRPVSIIYNLFGKRVGEFLFFVRFKGIPVTILSTFLLQGAGPSKVINFVLFLCSVFASIGIMFWIELMVGLISIYTLNSYGVAFTKNALLTILSGGVVPLFLFPEIFVKFLNYMPFASMVSVPIYIYLGKYNMEMALKFIGLQIIWIISLGGIAILFFKLAIKKIVVQGG